MIGSWLIHREELLAISAELLLRHREIDAPVQILQRHRVLT